MDGPQPGTATGRSSTERLPRESVSSGEAGPASLESELAARIRHIGLADPRRAREVFVETVMARELGLDSTPATHWLELAHRVAAQIGSHPRLSTRLHAILTALAEQRGAD